MQTEMNMGMRLPGATELGFRYYSQNNKVYEELAFYYHPTDPELSWTPTDDIAKIVPGGVTRRINDIRVALQPERTLRGEVGWWVENKVEMIHDPIQGRKVKHSWYRLIYLVED